MSVLSPELRKRLEDACVRGRSASESACRSVLGSLGVADQKVPAHLIEEDRALRRGLRAKSRRLGDAAGSVELLAAECAFEQWHRLLFARFLAENGLLIHPEYGAAVTLTECEELAEDLGEPDGWAVAGRFAAEILPGIFRLDDPCVQLRLAPEGRQELEQAVAGLPVEVFTADDALGWVYQFWQKEKKDEVNASERKIGGADLGPVTQLFTENYMVRFLLENSLGAWWAARHPQSPLVKDWEYLRFDDGGAPAAGSFDGWPGQVADVTVMDPCCGSGHFLVEAFGMLWRMRAEEEGLTPTAAQDAVLRDNLFGLELDPRCVQIAMFAVALAAWKGSGGWRELPVPHVACSGIPVRAAVEDWKALAGSDPQLENALVRLHILFRDADSLGSLIDPKRAVEITDPTGLQSSFEDVNWDDIVPVLDKALSSEGNDPATAVLGTDAAGVARAAGYLSRRFTLVCTNVPYLGRGRQATALRRLSDLRYSQGAADLAGACALRCRELAESGGTAALVLPETLFFLKSFEEFRRLVISDSGWSTYAALGPGAFGAIGGEVVQPVLWSATSGASAETFVALDCRTAEGVSGKARLLQSGNLLKENQASVLARPGMKVALGLGGSSELLSKFARSVEGLSTGDSARFRLFFWEISDLADVWERFQTAPSYPGALDGLSSVIRWEKGHGPLASDPGARIQGLDCWGRDGVLVGRMGSIVATRYAGGAFDKSCVVLLPFSTDDLPAVSAFARDPSYEKAIRSFDKKVGAATSSMVEVPFDSELWRTAAAAGQHGSPDRRADDPTQWLFGGRPEIATEPVQAAVGRLLGYRWPEQLEADGLDELADDDGIVCLPSVLGERTAGDRLQELLARAFGVTWSPARTHELLAESGSKKKDLESWLRDDFFKAHCQLFKNRPFVWQIWDGRKDGFSALVNYHRLDRATLERLTYTYLGDWIERQTAGVRDDVAGAEERLAAAQDLQQRLELILEGEPPYGIYVRWKSLAEQPMGWDPDLNDGVRLNVRPFVEAGVLRSKFNVKWDKDRGKNVDGSERINNLHVTLVEKQAARTGNQP